MRVMDLKKEILSLLKEQDFSPDNFKDQNFCIDDSVFKIMLEAAEIKKDEIILEIGAGPGILTRELAKVSKKVISIELDERLKPFLQKLPGNVELIFGNALEIIPNRKDFTKIIANIPYQICEPLFHLLCVSRNLNMAVLTVPKKFAARVSKHPIFSAFFDVSIIKEVSKEAFYPAPKVLSAVIKVVPLKELDDSAFIRRKLYLQSDKRLKNGLRDTLIDYWGWKGRKLTKKEALKIVEEFRFSEYRSETTIARMPLEMYEEIVEKIRKYALE